ncbi:MAG: bifunctional indole-3-glycerol phosphate synthase/phosphoribosylanthranilate isomerase [Treponema sp.]|nr:bifunctional indole-3-glycerol phosphate synthase/phosphoribosylanthranilate isomerase [Treponema sp.]MBQ7165846.1 bifunctional indole-3-glycerol phosphate synthase/phosphoribosylanthranilate isomerase [Treponema sp.]
MLSEAPKDTRNIIEEIVARRKEDIGRLGWEYGSVIPKTRQRGKPLPFISEKGVVLEVKRASPSKGDIAPGLDAPATATAYAQAGAAAISVLTERNYFKGGLDDLVDVCKAVDSWSGAASGRRRIAVLRKDFIYSPEEVDVAYRAGADAVLLIARMLDEAALAAMLMRCGELGMTAFTELRLAEDLEKLVAAKKSIPSPCRIVCGVNARDLKDFSIDLLKPASMLSRIRELLGPDCGVIFESGIRTQEAASFAGSLGFTGMLLGEAAARNPGEADKLVSSFTGAKETGASRVWLDYASLLGERRAGTCCHREERSPEQAARPLLKICGLTDEEDALESVLAGADFLGFIFCKQSPRNTTADLVRKVRARLSAADDGQAESFDRMPFLVGVITDCGSDEGKEAIRLVQEGTLDFLQLHGEKAVAGFHADKSLASLPHYAVVNLSDESDLRKIESLKNLGEPRILIDAKAGKLVGGTGVQVEDGLVRKVASASRLWLAGGITPENVARIVSDYGPELIDVSSGIESSPGKKDADKLLALVQALG